MTTASASPAADQSAPPPGPAPVGTPAPAPAFALPPPIRELTAESPPLLAWLVPLALMAATAAGLTWAAIGEVDIVAPAQGTLLPSGRVKVIQPPEQRVVSRILVREGQHVAAGTPLLEFETSDLAADRDRLAKELAAARLRAARLRAALDGETMFEAPEGSDPGLAADERRLLAADLARLAGEAAALRQEQARLSAARDGIAATVAKLEALLPLVTRRVEARRSLVESGNASLTAFLELRQEQVTLESDLAIQRAALREAEAAQAAAGERLDQSGRDHRLETAAALVEAETRASALVEDLRKAEQRLSSFDLRAPEDGTVHELALHTVGAVVQAAQPLMKLVPAGAALEAEAKVLNRDIGFLRMGQEVQVKLDAFPFTKYGAVPGRVAAVSSDVVPDERLGPVYHVRVALDRQTLEVEGRPLRLTPGMTATVDIHTGRRRVIDYLLGPIMKYRDESLRER